MDKGGINISVQTDGKRVMLEAFGGVALSCALYDEFGDEIDDVEYPDYERQVVSWTYDGVNIILNATQTGGIVAEFSVPIGTIKYVGFLNAIGDELYLKHDLDMEAETFNNPGIYQVIAASLELDPEV